MIYESMNFNYHLKNYHDTPQKKRVYSEYSFTQDTTDTIIVSAEKLW